MEGGGKMIRRVLIFTLLLLTGSVLFGVDFGGLIHNETGFSAGGTEDDGPTPLQLNLLSIWFNSGRQNRVVFSVGGSYTFTLKRPYLFDIYDFKLSGMFPRENAMPGEFSFDVGRFTSRDFTGHLFHHNLDGIRFGFVYPRIEVHTDVGFAGLQFKPTSTMVLSKLDYNEQDIDSVILGPKRLVGLAEIDVTNLFQRQTLSFGLLAQEDLRFLFQNDATPASARLISEGETVYSPERGGLVDTQYFYLGMRGPIATVLFYDVFGGLNTGRSLSFIDGVYTYTPVLGVTAGFNIRYYNENFLYSRMDLGLTFASGDDDSELFLEGNTENRGTKFIPPSVISTGTVFSPVLSNLFYLETSYYLKPLAFIKRPFGKKLELGVDTLIFFRSTPTQISIGGIDPSSDSLYLGTELDTSIDFRLFSDVGFSIAAGWFFPSPAAFLPEKLPAWFVGKFTASLRW